MNMTILGITGIVCTNQIILRSKIEQKYEPTLGD